MGHPICRGRSFEIVSAYTLRVRFDDRTEQTIDLRPILAGELYGPLRDPELFNRVRIDTEVDTLVWPNGADFDPETLHDWPSYAADFELMTRQWDRQIAECREEPRPYGRKAVAKDGDDQ